eukprot:753949-Hanusia_phi.AAC.1
MPRKRNREMEDGGEEERGGAGGGGGSFFTITFDSKDGSAPAYSFLPPGVFSALEPESEPVVPKTQQYLERLEGLAVCKDGGLVVTEGQRVSLIDQEGWITFLAGCEEEGLEDGVGEQAKFNSPVGIVESPAGDFYLCDQENHCIRKVTRKGEVTTVAGNGEEGFKDGKGKDAELRVPTGLCMGLRGDIIFADSGNQRIRRVSPDGTVTTIAGSLKGYKDGPVKDALFNCPAYVAADSQGNLFVSDFGNHCIRKIDEQGMVSTVAGSGKMGWADGAGAKARFNSPQGMCVDRSDNIYVADYGNERIRKINKEGEVVTVAGSGEPGFAHGHGSLARFRGPRSVAVSEDGTVFVGDRENFRVRKITEDGYVWTFAGSGKLGGCGDDACEDEFCGPTRRLSSRRVMEGEEFSDVQEEEEEEDEVEEMEEDEREEDREKDEEEDEDEDEDEVKGEEGDGSEERQVLSS